MLIIMIVTLYTSRLVLKQLGITDFGIYSVIGSVVISCSFISTAMTQATQRFLSFELGANNMKNFNKTISISILLYIFIGVFLFFIFETIGLYVLKNYLRIPAHRMQSALWTYHLSVLTFIVSVFRIPYNAAIIAYEKMSFFAISSIFETILKLAIVFLLAFLSYDKLVLYSFLLLCVSILTHFLYYFYCRLKLNGCILRIYKDKNSFKKLLTFSGWSTLGGFSTVLANQGLNILLNIFSGVITNAGMGIANQVSYAVNMFAINFQMAFNPQIVKSYASHNWNYLNKLLISTSKFSYYLLLIIIFPILIFTSESLAFWLTEVPPYAVNFCRIILISVLIDSLSAPLWMCIQATGKIKNYQIILSLILILSVLLIWLLLRLEYNVYIVVSVKIISSLLLFAFRLIYVNRIASKLLSGYFLNVILKVGQVSLVASVSLVITLYLRNKTDTHIYYILFATLILIISIVFCIYSIGLTKKEKSFFKKIIKKRNEK